MLKNNESLYEGDPFWIAVAMYCFLSTQTQWYDDKEPRNQREESHQPMRGITPNGYWVITHNQ